MFNLLSPIKDIMSKNLITIDKDSTLINVKEIFNQNKIHHIPVVELDKLIGIVSKSDFLFFQRGFSANDAPKEDSRLRTSFVHQIMTSGVAKLDENDKINVALEVFKENLFHAIPIESKGKLKGIITTFDIVNALATNKGAVSEYELAS